MFKLDNLYLKYLYLSGQERVKGGGLFSLQHQLLRTKARDSFCVFCFTCFCLVSWEKWKLGKNKSLLSLNSWPKISSRIQSPGKS